MSRTGFVLVLTLVAGASLLAQREVSAQTFTPGDLAIAAGNRAPASWNMIRQALAHPDPAMRGVAARLVNVSLLPDFTPDLVSALADEHDDAVAAELVAAALELDTPETTAAARAYLSRAGSRAAAAYALGVARHPGPRLLEDLPAVLANLESADQSQVALAVATAARRTPPRAEDLTRAWMDGASPSGWRAFLDHAATERFGPAALRAGLASTRDDIRERTVWKLVEFAASKADIPRDVINAAVLVGESDASLRSWEEFGRELLARSLRRARPVDRALWLEEFAKAHRNESLDAALLNLTPGERAILVRLWGDGASLESAADARESRERYRKFRTTSLPAMRTVRPAWPGFLTSVLNAANCPPVNSAAFVLFQVTYRDDGRPSRAVIDGNPGEQCVTATRAVIETLLADPSYPVKGGDKQLVLLPLHADVVACMDLPREPEVPAGASYDVEEPKRTRFVQPRYPESSVRSGAEGIVLIDAAISHTGCVRSADVVHSVTPALDHVSLLAVTQWGYSPTLLDGVPIAVVMTVTVNFTLH